MQRLRNTRIVSMPFRIGENDRAEEIGRISGFPQHGEFVARFAGKKFWRLTIFRDRSCARIEKQRAEIGGRIQLDVEVHWAPPVVAIIVYLPRRSVPGDSGRQIWPRFGVMKNEERRRETTVFFSGRL